MHCGGDHLKDYVREDNKGWMAAMLRIDFNIDPLTIDQLAFLEENNDPYFNLTNVKEPSVYVSNNGFFTNPADYKKVDMAVFFPKTKYINGRPNWLVYDKSKKYYFVSHKQNNLLYPIMISAFCKGEDISVAVPADLIEIEKQNDKIALVLNKGEYTIQIKDSTGKVEQQTIEIK